MKRGTPLVKSNFKTSVLKPSLCDCIDAYILVNGTITITGGREGATDANKRLIERTKGVIFKNYAPFTDCTSKVYNTQVENAKDLDVVMRCII